jgi:hypothetical protein
MTARNDSVMQNCFVKKWALIFNASIEKLKAEHKKEYNSFSK